MCLGTKWQGRGTRRAGFPGPAPAGTVWGRWDVGARGVGVWGYVITFNRSVAEGVPDSTIRLPRLRSGTQGGC